MANEDVDYIIPTKRLKPDWKSTDDQDPYFKAYGDIGIHQEMIADYVRTATYRCAILKNFELIHGKVVADIGAGTGILSMFCVQAGAKKVYAIEASDMAAQAELVIDSNGMKDRITVVHGRVEDVTLPEKVDVIVSEWMGYCLFYESMLTSVLHARDHWLKQGGVMLPNVAKLYLAPLAENDELDDGTTFWDGIKEQHGVDLSALKPYARTCHNQHVHIQIIPPDAVMAAPVEICNIMLDTVKTEDIKEIQAKFSFSCFGCTSIIAYGIYFQVNFPSNIVLSTSPYTRSTHWQQSVLYIDQPLVVAQDDLISGSFRLSSNKQNHRFLDIDLKFLHKNSEYTKHYLMDDFLS